MGLLFDYTMIFGVVIVAVYTLVQGLRQAYRAAKGRGVKNTTGSLFFGIVLVVLVFTTSVFFYHRCEWVIDERFWNAEYYLRVLFLFIFVYMFNFLYARILHKTPIVRYVNVDFSYFVSKIILSLLILQPSVMPFFRVLRSIFVDS